MILDHAFVLVRPWRAAQTDEAAADELAASLEGAGFVQGRHRRHVGQGSENRCFRFDGFMLELLFVVSRDEAADARTAPLSLLARRDDADASPFGFASRPTERNRLDPDYPHLVYRPAYLPPPLGIAIARDVPVAEPLWFHLPFAMPDAHAADSSAGDHPNGARRLRRVRLAGPSPLGERSRAVAAALGIEIVVDDAPGAGGQRLTLELEGERLEEGRFDPHPHLPLTIDCRGRAR